MKLVEHKTINILDKEVTISISVKELISMRAVFGELAPSDFDQHMKAGREDVMDLRDLIDKMRNEPDDVQDIYDNIGDILAEVLEK